MCIPSLKQFVEIEVYVRLGVLIYNATNSQITTSFRYFVSHVRTWGEVQLQVFLEFATQR